MAKDLGVNENTLHQWRRHAISDGRMPVDENETPEQKIRRLERELKLVTEERDIIKKAIAECASKTRQAFGSRSSRRSRHA